VSEPTTAPTILTSPVSASINVGQSVNFSVSASGTSPLSYQWQKNSANIGGATQAVFSIQSAQPVDAGDYRVIVSNSFGNATSTVADLTVRIPPTILNQPVAATVNIGQAISFSVTVSGTSPFSYQWQREGIDIGGATQAMLTIASVQPTDAGTYRVVVTNAAGSVTSTNASLIVRVPPTLLVQPASVSVNVGQPASFSVTASGTAPLSYQWQKGGVNISGATQSIYSIASAQLSDAGDYRVVVSNSVGSVTSSVATLAVSAPNQKPVAKILLPLKSLLYTAGTNIDFSGQGTDPEQGDLPASAFSWQVNFHHDTHQHDEPAIVGVKQSTYTIPDQGETSDNVWYRFILTVRDAQGLEGKDSVDVFPKKSTITLATDPAGLQLTLDGQPFTSPQSVVSVQGILRNIGVISPQQVNGKEYEFVSWSNNGSEEQTLATPAADILLTAKFSVVLAVEDAVEFSVYPNPASQWLYLKTYESATVLLRDVLGKTWNLMLSETPTGGSAYIGDLPPGLYVLSNGKKGIKKIVIQH
jgi:Immunoglobulin I-set domain/Immunoglobulin domain